MQSGVYRTTLAAVLICPVASAALSAAGFDGLSLRLPVAGDARARPSSVPPPRRAAIEHRGGIERSRPALRERARADARFRCRQIGRSDAEYAWSRGDRGEPAARRLSPAAIAAIGLAVWLLGSTFMGLAAVVGSGSDAQAAGFRCSGRGGGGGALPRRRAADECHFADRLAKSVPLQPVSGRASAPGDPVAG